MIGIPTDCPQRDERLGWMGDIQVFSGTSMFNADMAAFFTKWLRDVRDAQTPDGRFADFSPQPFRERLDSMHRADFTGARDGATPAWWSRGGCGSSTATRQAIRDNYDAAKKWVEYIRRNNPDLAVEESARQRLRRLAQCRHGERLDDSAEGRARFPSRSSRR